MKFSLVGDGLDRLDEELVGIARRTADMRPAWHQLEDDFLSMERRIFAQRGPTGARWPPLSTDWARRKRRKAPGAALLVLSARLLISLTRDRAKYAIRRMAKQHVVMGTKHPLAHLHDSGTRNGLPRRRLIQMGADDRDRWRSIVEGHIVGERSRILAGL